MDIGTALENIGKFFAKIWGFLKRVLEKAIVVLKDLNNFLNGVDYLLNGIVIAVSLIDKIADGAVKVINCLYNKRTEHVVRIEEEGVGINTQGIDEETAQMFDDNDMLIL